MGLIGELFAIVTLPLTLPATDGVKVTEKVHLAPAAKEPPHGVAPLPTAVNSAEAVKEAIVTAVVPLFVMVTTLGALVVPIS
jgi:hypothetical protein